MKDYCPKCSGDMDEVDIELKMCYACYCKTIPKLINKAVLGVKYPKLTIINKKKNIDSYYVCNTAEWNFYLDRYYPKAELVLIVEHLNNSVNLKSPLFST